MLKPFSLFVFCAFISNCILGQTTYNMSNQTVYECEGVLIDSEEGKDEKVPGGYDHNEDFVFTICVPNTQGFTISFSEFFLEEDFDFLTIYDGPNIASPLIGKYTGGVSPGTITTVNDCITIHFTSDGNISAPGFRLTWDAVPPEPIPPVFNPSDFVTCESTEVTLTLDKPIPCSDVNPINFQFSAPSGSSIASATALNCSGGNTSEIQLAFDTPLNESGRYWVVFTVNYTDVCGYTYTFDVTGYFDIIDCPLELDLLGNLTFCEGGCINLFADARGGNPSTYVFDWNNGTIGPANRTFCPTGDTIIYVTVSDDSPSPSASDSIILTMIPSPTATSPFDTICRNEAIFNLSATPTGGTWSGQGIIDANTGAFRPSAAPNGNVPITYNAPNGCPDVVNIFVLPINAGPTDIACVNSATFRVRGGNPSGGFWSGSTNIDNAGNYTPTATVFTDTVTYNAPNGCSSQKLVKMVDSVNVQLPDTVCVNTPEFALQFSPFGGVWSTSFSSNGNNGITNNRQGLFNPAIAGVGLHQLQYDVFGCYDSTSISVIDISAGIDEVYCPEQDTFNITTGIPAGGFWTGVGIVDSTDGTFDPTLAGGTNFNTTLTYSFQGCTDDKIIYVYQTSISQDTISFCNYDNATTLTTLGVYGIPGGGSWSGIGISNIDSITPQAFDSAYTYIYYSANTCTDSMTVQLFPKVQAQNDTSVCPSSPDFNLLAKPKGGLWSGYGIINPDSGTFSPDFTGTGVYTVSYTINGCTDQMRVTVDSLEIVITDNKANYCYNSTPQFFNFSPNGGNWSGNGITDTTTGEFVSSIAGEGFHTLTYTYGSGECAIADSIVVNVRPKLTTTILLDTTALCYGENRELVTVTNGGYNILGYDYEWSHNLPESSSVIINGDSSRTYYVKVNDNCSDPGVDSITVTVLPAITYTALPNDTVCYGTLTNGAFTQDDASYAISWITEPVLNTFAVDSIIHGRYEAIISDTTTGCSTLAKINLPAYPYLNALFDFTPNECLFLPDTMVYFVDLSSGIETGFWQFETITGIDTIPYQIGGVQEKIFRDTGTYSVSLTVFNGNGRCSSSFGDSVCINPAYNLFLPDAFSPNGDGINDYFPNVILRNGKWVPLITGATDYEMRLYDRWGELIYACDGDSDPWNGGWKNNIDNQVPDGVYSYFMKITFKAPLNETRIGKVVIVK